MEGGRRAEIVKRRKDRVWGTGLREGMRER